MKIFKYNNYMKFLKFISIVLLLALISYVFPFGYIFETSIYLYALWKLINE